MKTLIIQFLTSFFHLFDARINRIEVFDDKIIGTIEWVGEEEQQDFCWKISDKQIDLSKLTFLCVFIRENNLINGDKIIIPYNDLLELLRKRGWNYEDAKFSLDYLCSFDVKMIDDGEETDSFYIHF